MNETKRIIVVDDSPEDRAQVKAALLSGSTTRFKFLEAWTCAEALKIFNDAEARSIDCMILDFDLPDGEATDILAALPRFENVVDVPVLVLTGSGIEKNKIVLRAGAHEYLGKDWMTPSSITRSVENAIDRHSTSRQLAESHARLRESEAFAQSILNSSPDCVQVLDESGKIIHINPVGLKLLELDSFQGVQGKNWAGSWPEELRPLAMEALAQAAADKTGRFQGCCPTFKGTPKHWDVIINPIRTGDEGRFLSVSRDISSLRHSEDLVRESEKRFRNIADSSPVVIWVIEATGACSYLNKKWTEMTGQTEVQWSGAGWLNAISPEDRKQAARILQESVVLKKAFSMRLRIIGLDGAQTWMLMAGSPRTVNGVFMGFVGSATDLTDQKDLEHVVSERTAKLTQTIGELESVSYSLSHDLRQPLRSMQQTSQILLEDYAETLDETAQEHLNRIINASRRLDRLIQDVLTLGRVSRMGDHLKELDLHQLIKDVITQYAIFQAQKVEVEFVGEILPVHGHEALLGQIVSNLLGNAVKFKSPDRPLTVKITTEVRGEFIRLTIEDNGIGIAPENLDRIWKIFERVPGVTETEGTGIGLAIVKRAAERMDGQVGVQSVLNQGSRFWVEIPKPD